MEKKVISGTILSAVALIPGISSAADKDHSYQLLKAQYRLLTEAQVVTSCIEDENFDFDSFNWDLYEIPAFQLILNNIENSVGDFCQPPDLTGLHAMTMSTCDGKKECNEKASAPQEP